jgi:hypothetical protein
MKMVTKEKKEKNKFFLNVYFKNKNPCFKLMEYTMIFERVMKSRSA